MMTSPVRKMLLLVLEVLLSFVDLLFSYFIVRSGWTADIFHVHVMDGNSINSISNSGEAALPAFRLD